MTRKLLMLATLLSATPLFAQQTAEGFGTLDPTLPANSTVAQVIQNIGRQESAFAAARDQYTFRQDVRFNTLADDTGSPDGEYHQITDISFDDAGHRVEHVVFAPQNTIERVTMTENDFKDIEQRLPFILTAPELPDYTLTYLGKQHVDKLDTFVFDCKPRQLVKGHRYFQGKVWVDQQDNEIVLINGAVVPQDTRPGHQDLSPPFMTYYAQIDGKYWFPVYTKAEGMLHFTAQQGALSQTVHVRTIVRYTDYKRFHANVTLHYGDEVSPDKSSSTQPDSIPPP